METTLFVEHTESTIMSILHGVTADRSLLRRESLNRFCEQYTQPLVAFLKATKKLSEEDAESLVHDFWLEKMLEPPPESNLVSKYLKAASLAGPDTSFRRYLSRSLTYFLLSKLRRPNDAPVQHVEDIESLGELAAISISDEIEFDIQWANQLLNNVLQQVKAKCNARHHQRKWMVFLRLILLPCGQSVSPPSYAELAGELGTSNPATLRNDLVALKQFFSDALERAVQDYLPAHSHMEQQQQTTVEAKEILLQLSRRGGLRLPLAEMGLPSYETDSEYTLDIEHLTDKHLFDNEKDLAAGWKTILASDIQTFMGPEITPDCASLTISHLIEGRNLNATILMQLRNKAKALGSNADSTNHAVPREIYGLLYLLANLAAQQHLGICMTSQSQQQLHDNAARFANYRWVDEATSRYLQQFATPTA